MLQKLVDLGLVLVVANTLTLPLCLWHAY